jgi:hypothetical protein
MSTAVSEFDREVNGTAFCAGSGIGDGDLHQAVQKNDPDRCRVLLAAGVDGNARDWLGNTPLWYHVTWNSEPDEDLMRLLLTHGADPQSLLFEAAIRGKTPTLRLLLQHGADPNTTRDGSNGSETALCAVVSDQYWLTTETKEAILNTLLDFGADPALPSGGSAVPRFPFIEAASFSDDPISKSTLSIPTLKRLYRCSIAPFFVHDLSMITKRYIRNGYWEELTLFLQSGVLFHASPQQLEDIFVTLFPAPGGNGEDDSPDARHFPDQLDPYDLCIDLPTHMARRLPFPEELMSLRHQARRDLRKQLFEEGNPRDLAVTFQERVRSGRLPPELPSYILRSWAQEDTV